MDPDKIAKIKMIMLNCEKEFSTISQAWEKRDDQDICVVYNVLLKDLIIGKNGGCLCHLISDPIFIETNEPINAGEFIITNGNPRLNGLAQDADKIIVSAYFLQEPKLLN